MDFLNELNSAQREAAQTLGGPLLVIAGAGAGKTKTITYRILNLIKNGVAPENILAVTFTNKAAKEMRERVIKLLGKSRDSGWKPYSDKAPFVSTFHGLGALIIKENAKELGLKKNFSIYSRDDSKKTLKEVLVKNNLNPKELEPGKILSIISREKGNMVTAEEYSEASFGEYFGGIVAKCWLDYDAALKKENALDFDDLLLLSSKLLQKEEIGKVYSEKWKYIHIDEYQDTNKVQYQMAKSIVSENNNICAVGDVDQNIYSWRGANIRNILNFERDYPGTKIVLLEENYRSTKTILEIANRAIEKNKLRQEKILRTQNRAGERAGIFAGLSENHEAQFVAEKAKELNRNGVPFSEMAVLYRANFQSRALEEEFLAKEVPYQVLGTRFFERKEIKDILAFLRFCFNPESVSDLKRIINVPPRGIGKSTLLKIVEGKEESLPAKMKKKMALFRDLLGRIKRFAMENSLSKTVVFIAKETGLSENLEKTDEGEERIENIKELAALASRYDFENREEGVEKFLEDVSLASDQDSDKENADAVRLMTVHASKGLEFSYVFITGLEEGLFPSDRDRDQNVSEEEAEEERRLFYVAVTRAKKKLFFSYAETRAIFGNRSVNMPSEFILEIPDQYLEKEFLDYTPKRRPLLHIEF